MNIKNKLKFQFSTFQYSSNRRKGFKNLFVSILAILSAIIISLLITVIIYHDFSKFGGVLKQIFLAPFQDSAHANYTVSTIAIFGVAALSFLYAFRAGLFNIGISGQMLFAGIIAVIIGQHIGNALPSGIGQIIMLLICILSGMLIAGIIGVLKAFVNLNEVVSSITFNWIIYFVGTWLLVKFANTTDGTNSAPLANTLILSTGSNTWLPLIIIFILLTAATILTLSYTTFGKKIINTGMSLTASQYAGYSVKLNQILAMLVSGGLAGVLGMMVYLGRTNSIPMNILAKSIPSEGFSGISVGLIAMSNPWAVMPISLFFGMIDGAKGAIQSVCHVDPAISDLIFGIVVYGAAIVMIFYYIVPYTWYLWACKGKGYAKSYDAYFNNVQVSLEECWNAIHYLKQQTKNKGGENLNDIDPSVLEQLKIPVKDLNKDSVVIYQQKIYQMFFMLQKISKYNYHYEAIGINKNEYIKKIDCAISKYKEKKINNKVNELTAKKQKYIKKIDNRLMTIHTSLVELQTLINKGGE